MWSGVVLGGRGAQGRPRKLLAANSRSGSTEGHGASGNLCATGVLLAVCGFSSKLAVKKRGSGRKGLCERCKIEKSFRFQSIFRNSN